MEVWRPAWKVIDTKIYRKNIRQIKASVTAGTEVLIVLKDDAYGCGAGPLAKVAWDEGIRSFAVSNMKEATELRKILPEGEILLLGYTFDELYEEAIDYGISLPVWNLSMAEKIADIAEKKAKTAQIHLTVDTGLSRLGFLPGEEALEEIIALSKLISLQINGTYSHLARTETTDDEFSRKQLARLLSFADSLKKHGVNPGKLHISDSAGIIKFREADLDMVRTGALPVGSMTGIDVVPDDKNFPLESVLSLKARIARVAHYPQGGSVSYDKTFETDQAITVATLPIGYGDGLPFMMQGKMEVLIGGRRCPLLGVMNMDMIMVDVTGVPCKIGDEAVLLGTQGKESIRLSDWRSWSGKSTTFVQSMLRDRIPAVYQ